MSIDAEHAISLSIVVPVFREEKNVPEFLKRVRAVLQSVTESYEIIFCMDPSPDRTEAVIREENLRDSRVKLIKYARRVGQPMATLGGLAHAQGKAVVVSDVDLQDPPELIGEMWKKYQEGFDVVYAQRRVRHGETWVKLLVVKLGYWLMDRLGEVKIPRNAGEFRLMSRRVVEEVVKLKESHGFLRGLVSLVGFRQTAILFDRPARFAGQTNYNQFFGSIKIGLHGIICFSNRPLFAATLAAIACVLIALVTAFFHPIAALIVFMGAVQLLSVGILGEYIGRIYDEVKQRPKYWIDDTVGELSGRVRG